MKDDQNKSFSLLLRVRGDKLRSSSKPLKSTSSSVLTAVTLPLLSIACGNSFCSLLTELFKKDEEQHRFRKTLGVKMRLDLHYEVHHDEVLQTFSSGSVGSRDNICVNKCQRKYFGLFEEDEEIKED